MPAAKKAPKKTVKKSAPKAAAKSGSTLINFVLDKSGSMGTCLTDTIGGFNTYIQKLKEDKKSKYLFSLTLFDTSFENRHVAIDLSAVPELTTSTYVPGGMTALYDAIGKTVSAVESKGEKVDKVLTVILTDGQENSSREYKCQMIKDLITRKEKEGNWTFVFLGAYLSAFAVGDSMGVSHSNSIIYGRTQGAGNVYATMAVATRGFAGQSAKNSRDIMASLPKRALRAAGAAGMSRRTGPVAPGSGRR